MRATSLLIMCLLVFSFMASKAWCLVIGGRTQFRPAMWARPLDRAN
jgi:hypothetical protein